MDAASRFKLSQDWLVGDHVLMSWSFIKQIQDRRAETAFPPPPIRTVSGDKYLPGLLIIDKKNHPTSGGTEIADLPISENDSQKRSRP